MSYLKDVITDVLENYSTKADRLVFVTTGKRPALFLKKYFAEQVQRPTMAPEFIGIADLFTRISGVEAISGLPLLFEFYDSYKGVCKAKDVNNFEEFLGWAVTALKDFSEIDQYLVQPDKIFSYISDLRKVEQWSGMDSLTDLQKEYLAFWESLRDYYDALNEKLTKKKKGYAGFVAKKAVEFLPKYIETHTDTIHIFVGFNALSEAEQKVIQDILMDIGGEIYWDADSYFVNKKDHDAGYFFRKYREHWRYYKTHTPKFINNNYEKEKKIYLTGVSKSINQVHVVAELLQHTPKAELEKTARIVADESLLIPMLQAVQSNTAVNITMGYPLQQTPLNDLFTTYFRLHLSKSFYHKDVLNLLSQPFLKQLLSQEAIKAISEYITKHNLTYISREKLLQATPENQHEVFKLLFPEKEQDKTRNVAFISKLIENAITIIYRLKSYIDPENSQHILVQEYAYRFYELFNQLKQLQDRYHYIDSVKILYHFYLDVLQKSALNFRGEPLEGLQVMGVLESRSLDFENVIITSVNEGVLPLGKSDNSLIPYDVKRELGLPTYKERDAVYSYNFYRILQRAKKVHLLYDTEMDSLKSKEKSRFILQLLAENVDKHEVIHSIKAPKVYPTSLSVLNIQKTPEIIEKLRVLAENGLSPSAITTYIRNPLTFYQQNVLKVYEEQEVEETVEARTFGNIIHKTLECLYKGLLYSRINRAITVNDIEKIRPKVERIINIHFRREYRNDSFSEGKNYLIYNVIKEYVHRFLDLEIATIKEGTEIKVLCLEEKMVIPFEHKINGTIVNFKGIIDRIDCRDGKLQIIDYKTGVVEEKDVKINDWEDLIDDIKYGKAFQLLTYAYMYQQKFKTKETMQVANLSFKRLQKNLIQFHTHFDKQKDYDVTPAVLFEYVTVTKKLLEKIFDTTIPFSEVI